ncbi:uncharacterized protein LOC124411722 [Diprion similis]|uniref:uncharacterized protein LOC124411722 n=1 Tax=Diprion similis TaxID=362088 RepID=UPI001EF9483A|nr:uncharacterized protein LOC124411722 [Diprion similis]
MDEVYTKIQAYLMKRDREYETLRFLTSRTTAANVAQITDICTSIKTILDTARKKHDTDSTVILDERSIKSFKFLLLNTNFKVQEHFCDDEVNGHLVNMCPPLSPYLFIEILRALNYNEILCNSFPHLPMDLCTEILDVLHRCVDTDFQRAFDFVLKVIVSCYKKLLLVTHRHTQVLEPEMSLKTFVGSVQELLSLLAGLQIKNSGESTQPVKYKRCGWTLISLLDAIKECLTCRKMKNISSQMNEESAKLYGVTFGRNFTARLDPDVVASAIDDLTQELFHVLLEHVKKIDMHVYLGWADIDYEDDRSITMQRAVGLACYYFIEYFETSDEAQKYSNVVDCLRQLSSQPDTPLSMSLQELIGKVEQGDRECLRNLIKRFTEWDTVAISCLDKNSALIDKHECLSVLNNTIEFLNMTPKDEELCTQIYTVAMKILLGQKMVDMVEIVVEFILVHDACIVLESVNFASDLQNYVNNGGALCSNNTSLRIILFFILQNPREVLKVLIKAAIGCLEYRNCVVLPEDLCNLSPIMKIRDADHCSIFSTTLVSICSENTAWNSKKFIEFVHIVTERNLILADDLLNDIFIPCLRREIIFPNMNSMLASIRNVKDQLTPKLRTEELIYVLAVQTGSLRRNINLPISGKEEALNCLTRTIRLFTEGQVNSLGINGRDSSMQKLEAILQPLDTIYFTSQWKWIQNNIISGQVLQEYKMRCYCVMNRSKTIESCSTCMDEFFITHGIQCRDFLQHVILECTEFEYLRFAKDAIIMNWNDFGWKNELDAYANLSLSTTRACSHYLISHHQLESWKCVIQKITSLVKSLGKLTLWLISIDQMNDYESVQKSLVTAISVLHLNSILPSHLSESLKTKINILARTKMYSYGLIRKLVKAVCEFGDECLCSYESHISDKNATSLSTLRFCVNWKLISICTDLPNAEQSLFLSKIEKKIIPDITQTCC